MSTPWPPGSSVNESRRAARELFDSLSSGSPPVPVATSLGMQYGEYCVGEVPVTVLEWATGDASYVHKSGGYWGGGLVGLVALRGANAIGNSRRRRQAEVQSQGRWQEADRGRMVLTNKRIAIQGARHVDIWFQYLQSADCDGVTLQLFVQGWNAIRLLVTHPDYWYVLFNKMAYDRLILPPPESEPAS